MALATDALHLGWVCACCELTLVLSCSLVRDRCSFTGHRDLSMPRLQVPPRRRRAHAGAVSPSSTLLVQHHPRPRPRRTGASQLHTFAQKAALLLHRVSHGKLYFQTTKLHRHFLACFLVPLKQRARYSPRSIVGQVGEGIAQLGVSRRGRCFFVCASRSLVAGGAKKHRSNRCLHLILVVCIYVRISHHFCIYW